MAVPPTVPPADRSAPPAGRWRRRPLVALLATVIVVLIAAVACSGPSSPGAAGNGDGQDLAAGPAASTTAPPEPDKLPDPAVAPGTCKPMAYTPPTAKQAIFGELCRPKENQRDVAVLVVHGGSGISGGYENMRRWANRYLVEGYVTFIPTYHLFNEGGESPVFPLPEQNIKAAVQFVRGVGNAIGIRKDRIVVQGQSAGARVGAVAYATGDDPWFQGNELHPGISDVVNGFIGFYHPYDGTMQYAYQYFGGDDTSKDPKTLDRLDKADALAHATNAQGPALFITGDQDWSVIIDQQNAFVDALHGKGLAASALVIKGGGHGFDEGGSRLSKLGEESAVATLQFLNDAFPQTPARGPQSGTADVNSAPTYTGAPPTTYATRPTNPGGYNTPRTTRTTIYRAPSTTKPYVPSTTTPAPTSPPTTVPPSTRPPTTATPPTRPPTTTATPPTTTD
jgi:acetyl esterase/lipase